MKSFKQFQEQSLAQAFARAGKPGIPSEKPTSTTSLDSLRRRNTSDLAKPRGSKAGIPVAPLNKSSYEGRKGAGRNPSAADNPDFTGPLRGGGSGTKDKMPGTTPSLNPNLSQSNKPITKKIPKQTNNYN